MALQQEEYQGQKRTGKKVQQAQRLSAPISRPSHAWPSDSIDSILGGCSAKR